LTCLDENSPQFDSFPSVCMMVTAYSFVQHTVTHDYSVLTSIMKFNWKQTKTHSEKQKEVLEHENTLFSTKNACKGWPIGFMIWPIEILRKGPWAHLVKICPYHWSTCTYIMRYCHNLHQLEERVIRSHLLNFIFLVCLIMYFFSAENNLAVS
jgi:hypothetical protein